MKEKFSIILCVCVCVEKKFESKHQILNQN